MPVWERDVYTAFIRMYNKLRLHEGIILRPALGQMEALEDAVQRENPAMLEINRAIAQATEQNYKISKPVPAACWIRTPVPPSWPL